MSTYFFKVRYREGIAGLCRGTIHGVMQYDSDGSVVILTSGSVCMYINLV